MFLVFPVFLGLLSQTTAQSTTNPFAAATTDLSAPTGICNDENGLLSCIPQATVCPGTIAASVSSCGCTNVRTVINCYSTYCPAQLTEDEVMVLSSYLNVPCNGIGTITLPSGPLSTSGGAVPTSPSLTTAVTTSATGKLTGTGTASGGSISSTSKAAAERGLGNTVPVPGGVLGAVVGVVGLFL